MTDTQQSGLHIGHPAPQRRRVAPRSLLFGLLGAPVVWLLQLLIGFATTSYVCYTGQARVALAQVPGWLQPLLAGINLVALACALAALVTSMVLLGQTREEHQERSGDILDAGEGRTRFLAVVALFASASLAVAIFANTFSLFVVPLCRA